MTAPPRGALLFKARLNEPIEPMILGDRLAMQGAGARSRISDNYNCRYLSAYFSRRS
jgi:hypothetical protein